MYEEKYLIIILEKIWILLNLLTKTRNKNECNCFNRLVGCAIWSVKLYFGLDNCYER